MLFSGTRIFSQRVSEGAAHPNVNLGPPHISENIRARKLKFYTLLDPRFEFENFLAIRGVSGAQHP